MFPKTTYRDIGTVVYMLRAVPWTITDFTIERYRERLYRLPLQMKREGGFAVQGHARNFFSTLLSSTALVATVIELALIASAPTSGANRIPKG
jgi:hypothetical protein